MDTGAHKIVLGLPWLQQANPVIDWKNKTVSLGQGAPVKLLQERPYEDHIDVISATELRQEIDHNLKQVMALWVKALVATTNQQKIPKRYSQYMELFQEEAPGEELPKHSPWDHEIPLKPGERLKKKPLYPLSPEKLDELR